MASPGEQPVSFVIRLWLEPGDGERQWRGHVRHVQGQSEMYFRDFQELQEFLKRHSGVSISLSHVA